MVVGAFGWCGGQCALFLNSDITTFAASWPASLEDEGSKGLSFQPAQKYGRAASHFICSLNSYGESCSGLANERDGLAAATVETAHNLSPERPCSTHT